MGKDMRIEELYGRILVYDKLGSGHVELTEEEAERVRDKLTEILDD